jgi:hypothetical protein
MTLAPGTRIGSYEVIGVLGVVAGDAPAPTPITVVHNWSEGLAR